MALQDILTQISQLQQKETQMYEVLSRNAQNSALGKQTFTDTEIQDITAIINSLSANRVNLYNTIYQTYKSEASNETNAQASLNQQTQTLQLLEKELNKSKKKLASMKDEKTNQLKMIEITTYYSKQYDAHRRLMQMITVIGVCILIAIGLKYTPLQFLSTPLVLLICIVGLVLVFLRGVNMFLRRTDNYDEFIWPSAPTTNAELDANSKSPVGVTGVPFVCAESSCCSEGTVWSDTSGCVGTPK
jgi:hypothetical protein